jgi:HK97 family phage portal protein
VKGGLAAILHDAINDGMSSFEWRKYSFDQVFTGGRSFTFIERNAQGRVINLWPLIPERMTVKMTGWQRRYEYRDGSRTHEYEASEIIDIPFMLKSDRLSHRGPIMANRDAIGLAIAATNYGSKFFQNGGVPPFAVTGKFQSGAAMQRASDDFAESVVRASQKERQALVLPDGLEIKPLGSDPDGMQLVDLKRFCIEEIARVYSLPPTFLQDLTHGTFSNTEQQDLHFVKHTLKRWVEQTEQELNLKLFGRGNTRQFIEFNVDGLLRGDFRTRMEGYAVGIQNGVITPNEVRRRENMPDDPDGDVLLVNAASVPIRDQVAAGQNTDPQEGNNGT